MHCFQGISINFCRSLAEKMDLSLKKTFDFLKKNWTAKKEKEKCYRCYYPHRSRNSVSPVSRIFLTVLHRDTEEEQKKIQLVLA